VHCLSSNVRQKALKGNKSPDIYDGNGQRGFPGSQAMKCRAMKGREARGSSEEIKEQRGKDTEKSKDR
jgi:hypothetical protein